MTAHMRSPSGYSPKSAINQILHQLLRLGKGGVYEDAASHQLRNGQLLKEACRGYAPEKVLYERSNKYR